MLSRESAYRRLVRDRRINDRVKDVHEECQNSNSEEERLEEGVRQKQESKELSEM